MRTYSEAQRPGGCGRCGRPLLPWPVRVYDGARLRQSPFGLRHLARLDADPAFEADVLGRINEQRYYCPRCYDPRGDQDEQE